MNAPAPNGGAPARLGGLRGYLRLFVRAAPFALPFWDKLLLRIGITQANAFIAVFGVIAIQRAVDDGLRSGSARTFYTWSGASAALGLLTLVLMWIYGTMVMYVGMRVEVAMKRVVFDRMLRLGMQYHQAHPVGETLFRINKDTALASDLVGNSIPEISERFLAILTTVALAAALRPFVLLLILAYLAAYLLYSLFVVGLMYRFQRVFLVSVQNVTAVLQEILNIFPLTKAFTRERAELRRYTAALARQARAAISFFSSEMLWQHGGAAISAVWFVVSFNGICGYLTIRGVLTIGEWISTQALIVAVNVPIYQLIWSIQRLRVSAVPVQRVFQTLDLPLSDVRAGRRQLEKASGEIEFRNVTFRYSADGPDVIHDLSFKVGAGRKAAIVGPSGAGKTTVFNLLLRLHEPTSGAIFVDGRDLRDLDPDSYLRWVGVVLQDSFLFSASLRDNILFGNPWATAEQLQRAVSRAGLEATVRSLASGLDTVLLEGGDLSAGQKQRISVARAIVREPRFLLLDEATSLLDMATEVAILQQLASIEEGTTRLVIAHHLHTVADADEILVMDRGQCVQRGRHAHLAASDGLYRRLAEAEEKRHRANEDVAT